MRIPTRRRRIDDGRRRGHHLPLPRGPLGAAADAPPGAEHRRIRIAERDRLLRAHARPLRANVSAVATFYSQYKRRPNGEFTVGVCTNTLCAVMGGDGIF